MTPLRKRMIEDMKVRNYSPKTIKHYVGQVAAFAKYFGKSPDQLGPGHVRGYQMHLIEERKLSWSAFNIAACALRFFYRVTLKKDWMIEHLPYGKRPKTLPTVLGKDEVLRLFAAMPNPTYRIILMTAYSTGLRVSEVARLKVDDIDRSRMPIRVRQGKGQEAIHWTELHGGVPTSPPDWGQGGLFVSELTGIIKSVRRDGTVGGR
jgi:integrase/recombinase XerD